MTIDEAIADLRARHPEAEVGATAKAGNKRYNLARDLRFHFCQCALNDPAYATDEYVAEGPNGAIHSVGYGRRTKKISCGENGYHPTSRSHICPA